MIRMNTPTQLLCMAQTQGEERTCKRTMQCLLTSLAINAAPLLLVAVRFHFALYTILL